MTATNTDISLDSIVEAAAAVTRSLPAPDLEVGAPIVGAEGLGIASLSPGARAVSATLSGSAAGTIVLTISSDLAGLIENGPVGPQELTAGVETSLTDAVAAIDSGLSHSSSIALEAEVALANAAAHSQIVTIPISAATGPVAALVLLIDEQAEQPAPAAEASASFESLSGALSTDSGSRAVELLHDVEMGVTAELGRTRMTVRELLSLQPGSVVELDRAAGSPVDLLVNGTLVARGEVVVIDEEFGVRITEIIGYEQKKPGAQ